MRRCNKCGIEKPLEDFHRDKRLKEGRRRFIAAVEAADENLTMACDWSDFRKDYGISSDPEISSREHRAFKAGWQAGRHGDQSGVLR